MIYALQSSLRKLIYRNAFRRAPLHPSVYHLMGFKWEGKFYYDKNLPMGCASSCQIFEQISDALLFILKEHAVTGVVKVLDDFFYL